MSEAYGHEPVLLDECIEALAIRPDGVYVDATVGYGGHSAAIAERIVSGRLVCLDRDPEALRASARRLEAWKEKISFLHGDYRNMAAALAPLGLDRVNGILFDLGVSSPQFDNPGRGFSYRYDAPLDMRMNPGDALSAYDIVGTWPEAELRRILFAYGEENFAPLIAAAIVRCRKSEPIRTTGQLAEVVVSALPPAARRRRGHPAKQTFQAIRMAVNDELNGVEQGIRAALALLGPGGRLAVISFHSLEDRIVKSELAAAARGCVCPRELPVCVCGVTPAVKLVTRKPVTADETERERNRRAHSAKLRVAEKI